MSLTDPSDPYAEGAEAAHMGRPETANPYDPASDEHLSWNDGWASVQDEGLDD